MKKAIIVISIILVAAIMSICSVAAGDSGKITISDAAKSVLKISVYENDYDKEPFATGSGFVAINNSTLITNYHVINGAAEIFGFDNDGNVYSIDKVLCADKEADIAILEFSKPTDMKPLELYPDDQLELGSQVFAIGSPKGLNISVSDGVVSSQFVEDGVPWIQITAPISPGSSGGALLNDQGKVIGVTTASYKSTDEYGENTNAQNLNFAVNIAVAQAMYNAWDGERYSVGKQKKTAKMDYTGVYDHKTSDSSNSEADADNSNEAWVCLNCGKENTSKFCLECGAEKPYWVCSCGRENSSKFCGECGASITVLIDEFNSATEKLSASDYTGAIELLLGLGQFDSGSFETSEGKHIGASAYIKKVYYGQAVYLQSNNGSHEDIIASFENAGDYGDAKEQIQGENARYLKEFYDAGIELLNKNDYDAAVEMLQKAGEYRDAADQVHRAYYSKGLDCLESNDYAEARQAFKSAGDYQDAQTLILKTYYLEAEEKITAKAYSEALVLFQRAGDYSDSKDRINETYYLMAEEKLEKGDNSSAKQYFTKAGEYKDAKERIVQIIENENNESYVSAQKAFEQGNYDQAYTLFADLGDYRDSAERAIEAKICSVQKQFDGMNTNPNKMDKRIRGELDGLLTVLSKYKDNIEAQSLINQINYTIAKYYETFDFDLAITYFRKVGDYLDAATQIKNCQMKKMDGLVANNKLKEAADYYLKEIDPNGTGQDYILIKAGDKGQYVNQILSLLKPLGIRTKGQVDTEEYKEEYIPYIEAVEDHFGMVVDGAISIDEFNTLEGAIYQDCKSHDVRKLLEKLVDLSYLAKLPEPHSEYKSNYVSSVKKAETALGLLSDGIITQSEYKMIMDQPVEVPDAVQNLKMSVNKDTVTLTWSKVPGAVYYEVKRKASGSALSKIAGLVNATKQTFKTEKTSWTEKNVETGVYATYTVVAHKYTVESKEESITQYIDKYFIPITVANLNKSLSQYKGKYVKINSLRVSNWSIRSPSGSYSKNTALFYKTRHEDGYSVYLLCYSGNDYVELVLENYKNWGWQNDNADLLSKADKLTFVSITGQVEYSTADWTSITNVPSVVINHIQWNYR